MKIKNAIALILLVVAATTFIKKADVPVPVIPAVIPISPEWQVKVAEIRNIANQHSKVSVLVGKFYADFADVLNRDNEVITYGKLREVHKRAQALYAQKTPLVNSIPGISTAIDNVLVATFGLDDVAIDRAKVTNCFIAISWACGHNPQLVNSPSVFSETGPPSIKELYESGFKGVLPNPEAEKRFDEIMEWPNGGKVYRKFNIEGNGEGKLSIPFIYVEKLFPGCWPASAQQRGDCFVADTKVLMSDGSEKNIQEVKVADTVVSHLNVHRRVIGLFEKDFRGNLVVLQGKDSRTIEATPDHLFVAKKEKGRFVRWIPAALIGIGDEIFLTKTQTSIQVVSSEIKPFTGKVYCIEVETDHSFCANGYSVHNCVSHSTRNAVLTTLSTDIISGKPDEKSGFVETIPELPAEGISDGVLSTEAIYWWRRHGGDGWNCSDAAIVVCKESGLWLRKDYPEFGFNLTRYSASLAGKWGTKTPPSNIFSFGQQHLVHTSTRLSTAEQIRDFLANGYGLSSCGSEGFSDTRDENGVSGRSGSWSHAMAYIGYDDRPEIKKVYGEPLVLVLNSWGKWNKGPRVILGTNISIPEGSFWTKFSNVRNRSVYAFSGVNGWPQKRLPNYGTFIWG